jgi:hypothetical protein
MTSEQIGAVMGLLSKHLMTFHTTGALVSMKLGAEHPSVGVYDPWLIIAVGYDDGRDMSATRTELHRIVEACGLEDRIMLTDVLAGRANTFTSYTDIALNLGISARTVLDCSEPQGIA